MKEKKNSKKKNNKSPSAVMRNELNTWSDYQTIDDDDNQVDNNDDEISHQQLEVKVKPRLGSKKEWEKIYHVRRKTRWGTILSN